MRTDVTFWLYAICLVTCVAVATAFAWRADYVACAVALTWACVWGYFARRRTVELAEAEELER